MSVFLVVAALTLASVFLTAALTYATLSACDLNSPRRHGQNNNPVRPHRSREATGHPPARRAPLQRRTFLTTLLSFLGAADFLVTPVGFAPAFLAAGFLLIAGAVSTCWKTRGLELPVADRVPSRAIAS